MTSESNHWNIPSAVRSSSIFGYSNDGWKFGNASSYSNIPSDYKITPPFIVEFTVTDYNNSNGNPQPIFLMKNSNGDYIGCYFNSENKVYFILNNGGLSPSNHSISFPKPSKVRLEIRSNGLKMYLNDNLVTEKRHSISGELFFAFDTSSNRMSQIKDFKVKPL
jgi:hypothetical protein